MFSMVGSETRKRRAVPIEGSPAPARRRPSGTYCRNGSEIGTRIEQHETQNQLSGKEEDINSGSEVPCPPNLRMMRTRVRVRLYRLGGLNVAKGPGLAILMQSSTVRLSLALPHCEG